MQEKEALREEETSLQGRMQVLDNLSIAKGQQRRSYDGLSLTPTSIISGEITRLDDELGTINAENLQSRDRLEKIKGERSELDARLDALRAVRVAPAKVQELQESIGPLREEYILSLKSLRNSVELIKQFYRDQEDDPKIKSAIAAKNQGLKRRRYQLGPSPKFRDIERKLKQHEDWVKATTPSGRRRDSSKAATPAPGRLPRMF